MNEMKMTIAKLVSSYRLVATEKTKLNLARGAVFFLLFPGLEIKIERRTT